MRRNGARAGRAGNEMRKEYDFNAGVRGKHYRAMQAGYTVTIHHDDGTKTVKVVKPRTGVVVLDPDVVDFFPNAAAVNSALRALIRLVPRTRRASPRRSTTPRRAA